MELTLKEAVSTVEAYGLLDVDIPKPYKRAIQVLYDHAKKSLDPLMIGESIIGKKCVRKGGTSLLIYKIIMYWPHCGQYKLQTKSGSEVYLRRSEFEIVD